MNIFASDPLKDYLVFIFENMHLNYNYIVLNR